MARPTKLNFNTHNKIITAIRAGNYIETAAAYAGVNKSTKEERFCIPLTIKMVSPLQIFSWES